MIALLFFSVGSQYHPSSEAEPNWKKKYVVFKKEKWELAREQSTKL